MAAGRIGYSMILTLIVIFLNCNMISEASDKIIVQINVTYGQTEARSLLKYINDMRIGNDRKDAWYWKEDNTGKEEVTYLQPYEYDYDGEKVAMLRAAEIAYSYGDKRPNGGMYIGAYQDCGVIISAMVREDIAKGFSTAAEVFDYWKAENEMYEGQETRRNMLTPTGKIGIGHVYYNGEHYWVMEYISRGANTEETPAFDGKKSVDIHIGWKEENIEYRPAEFHTKSQIVEFINSHNAQNAYSTYYQVEPIVQNPYRIGRLSDDTLNGALNLLNIYRYIAGVPANVVLDEEEINLAQVASLVNASNDIMTHYPDKPSDMSEDIYALGAKGASSSNLGKGHKSLGAAISSGWMFDGNNSNIDRVGHRRWVLNPTMGKTGFGKTRIYSAMYSLDESNSEGEGIVEVAWPAEICQSDILTPMIHGLFR